jgi:hypothetical protein
MTDTKPIRRIAIIGTGVIGASWTALFLAKGLEVVATDVAPDAETSLRRFVKAAWPALERLGLAPGASQSHLTFTRDLKTAVVGADLVQENGPERIDFKKKLYRQGFCRTSGVNSGEPSIIAGLHAEVGSRSIPDLEAQRDEVLLGLLELRSKYEKPSALSQTTAQARRSRALS